MNYIKREGELAMKHILKKVLSLFMVFIVLMGIQPTTVYAETNPWEGVDISDFVGFIMTGYSVPSSWTVNDTYQCKLPNGHIQSDAEFYVNTPNNKYYKRELWCLDPYTATTPGYEGPATNEHPVKYITKKWCNGNTNKGYEMWSKIQKVMYFGYGFDGNKSNAMRFATQIHIWEILLGRKIEITKDPNNAVHNCYNTITNRMGNCKERPSFHDQTITIKGYGKENAVEVTDSKGIFENFENLKSTDNKIKVEKTGNKLKIWAEEGAGQNSRVSGVNRWFENHAKNNINYFSSPQPMTATSTIDMGSASQTCFIMLAWDSVSDPVGFRVNVKLVTGEVTVQKEDAETGNRPQGDATFAGAQFDLYEKDTNNRIGETVTLDANGTPNHTWSGLDITKDYEVREITAPTGYKLNSTPVNVLFRIEDGKQIARTTVKDEVIKGKVSIHKTYLEDNVSGIPKDESGAEFEVKDSKGNVVETLVTDENGRATSKDLPYGKYTLKQTKAGGEYAIDEHEYSFSIVNDGEVIPYESIVNTTNEYIIKLVKKDANSGKFISYTGAKFQFYKKGEDKPISVRVGKKKFDTFVTKNSTSVSGKATEFYAVDEDDMGTIETPLVLKAGTYILKEIETPKGYSAGAFKDGKEIVVGTGAEGTLTQVTEDGKPMLVIEVENKPYMGQLEIEKSILSYTGKEYDKTQIEFTIFAKNDYRDPATGKVLVKAGSPIQTIKGKDTEYSGFVFSFSPVYEGDYIVKETRVPDGLSIDKKAHEFIVKRGGKTTFDGQKVYWNGAVSDDRKFEIANEVQGKGATASYISIVNKETSATFSKEDAGGKEVEGAKLQVKDENGKVLDEWTSTKEVHVIHGLVEGKKYTLHEDLAPTGMNLAQDITFTVGVQNHINMVDTMTNVTKVDENGKVLKGAKLQVKDKNGKVVDEWTSDTRAHSVSGLTAGQTYTLHEVEAPKGYKLASAVKFKVLADKDTAINFTNVKAGATGVTTNIVPLVIGGVTVIALVAYGGWSLYKKRKQQ